MNAFIQHLWHMCRRMKNLVHLWSCIFPIVQGLLDKFITTIDDAIASTNMHITISFSENSTPEIKH